LRILFVIDTLGAGGAERSLQEMVPHFRAAGVDVHIACFHRRKDGVEHLVFGSEDVRVLDRLSRLQQVRELRRIIRAERIELVHTTLFEADVLGRLATAGTRVSVVTSLVNMAYEPARLEHDVHVDPLRLAAVRALEAGTGLLFADHYHAITHAVKDAAITYYGILPRKITVVYRGRDERRMGRQTPERRQEARRRLGISEDAFVLLTAGRQEFQKGQRFLVEALAALKTELPNAVMLLAGREGSASTAIQRAISSLSVGSAVRMLGHRDDVPELMAASDLFVLPSLWEGLGGVLIEAMAMELPIVASDLEAVREATDDGEAAVLVPAQNAGALASAIVRLARSRQLRDELARRGRELFESRYTLERSARGMLNIFERAASQRATAGDT
jgi:glycosyltransferase involved in cell wall biosynthesis